VFTELLPVLNERDVLISLRLGQDGLVFVHVKPMPKEADPKGLSDVACVPFQGRFTVEQLDARFAPTLADWVNSRAVVVTDLDAALKASKAEQDKAAAAAREAAKSKTRTVAPASTKAAPAVSPQPSLLDAPAVPPGAPASAGSTASDEEHDEGDESGDDDSAVPPPPVFSKAAAVVAPVTESLF
jgi:hypothetical protein